MSEPESAEIKKVSFFKDLIHRRVPQIIGVYIAASWGIVQFLDWIVNRYLLSLHLVDLALVYLEMGDKEKAVKHLKIASEVWKDADPGYKPAQLAREKLSLL
jgi:hypothetical protein